jgi:hypothetical protein
LKIRGPKKSPLKAPEPNAFLEFTSASLPIGSFIASDEAVAAATTKAAAKEAIEVAIDFMWLFPHSTRRRMRQENITQGL